ncbi:uncharacterized protein LOC110300814 [Mus caroli]|uniref:Uncharacterized protein LOC110300814 n=1 Tax=Mus caroli TaxID=10089 RepID=A0A6P5QG42_MUSCR|nr:uncharacterized protein LOC110300814 [Mus caroli]
MQLGRNLLPPEIHIRPEEMNKFSRDLLIQTQLDLRLSRIVAERLGGRGGDVRAPPRPRLPGADRVLRLQSASQPVAAKDAKAASSFPAAVISVGRSRPHEEMSVPLLPAESWGSAECWLLRTHHRISQPGPPVALASRASEIPGPAAFPTPRTAGDALPLLQLKLLATCLCRPPGFLQGRTAISLCKLTGRLGLCRPPTSGDVMF